ncbi:hypothetical protein O6H91_10G100300 [Diphasiastrum complanatum]|uniref:Uncharacterized protein n=1 Tax=Diphasiastrum complanatum TaxID=34168 RepID=A0ACC2CK11_DIPCM|nr:hypothetical protein O6H91_10G100300 [Diphasiastrum complanatum]
MADPPLRLLNFVSESQSQLEEARASGGARVEDGIDRPLYEILKENKDKQEAEFNDRFKHRPPKALDEDETEFLDQLEMVSMDFYSINDTGRNKTFFCFIRDIFLKRLWFQFCVF